MKNKNKTKKKNQAPVNQPSISSFFKTHEPSATSHGLEQGSL